MTTLSLTGISHTYPGDYPIEALRDITLDIHQGEYVALVGPSGSGKSTLLNVLGLLDTPTAGTYRIDNTDTAAASANERSLIRARTFGIIFQSFHLMDRRSSAENAQMGTLYHGLDLAERRALAADALAFVGLSDAADQRVSTMSGGQRQRVAIARAITTDAPVILADEPTGNLDSESGQSVIDTLERLNDAGATVIIVTHDPALARRARRVIRLVDGRIASDTARDPRPVPPPPEDAAARRYAHVRGRDMIGDIVQGLVTEPRRAIGLIAAIALAVAFALTTVGVAVTARYQVSDVFDRAANRRVTVTTSQDGDPHVLARLITQARSIDNLARVRAVAGVEKAAAFVMRDSATVSAHPGHSEHLTVVSLVDSDHPTTLLRVRGVPRGQPLAAGGVLVGARAADKLQLGPLDAAPVVTINGTPHTVVGVVEDAGLRGDLLLSVLVPDRAGTNLPKAAWASLEIQTRAGAARQVATQAAVAWMPTVTDGLTTQAPPDPTTMRATIEDSVAAILVTLTVVAILAAVIALAATMTTTVRRRYHEFGLRRTIGATRGHIGAIILIETLILAFLGGTGGAMVSVIATLGVAIARGWQPVIEPLMIPAGIALGLVVGVLGSLSGAWRASRIEPADALRM